MASSSNVVRVRSSRDLGKPRVHVFTSTPSSHSTALRALRAGGFNVVHDIDGLIVIRPDDEGLPRCKALVAAHLSAHGLTAFAG